MITRTSISAVLLVVLACCVGFTQDGTDASVDVPARIQALEAVASPTATQQQTLDAYREVLAQQEDRKKSREAAARYRERLDKAPERTQSLTEELSADPTDTAPVPEGLTLEQLERRRAEINANLPALRTADEEAGAELKRRPNFLVDAPKQLTEARRQLEELAPPEPMAEDAGDEARGLFRAQEVLHEARKDALRARIESLQLQLQFFETTGELLALQRDAAARRLDAAEKQLSAFREAILTRQEEAAAEARKAAEEAQEEALNQDPLLRPIAVENEKLAEERAALVDKLREAVAAWKVVNDQVKSLVQEQKTVKESVAAAQFSNAVGALLRTKRSNLPNTARYEQSRATRHVEIADAQFRSLALTDRIESLRDAELLQGIEDPAALARGKELVATQRASLRELQDLYGKYLSDLSRLDEAEGKLIAEVSDYAGFIDEQILWTQSSRPMDWTQLRQAPQAAGWLLDLESWKRLARSPRIGDTPGLLAWLAVLILLLAARPLSHRRIREVGEAAARPMCVSIRDTWISLGYTVILAAPFALLLSGIGWYFGRFSTESPLALSLSSGLIGSGRVSFVLSFCYYALAQRGLSEAHFETRPETAARLRRAVWLLMVPAIPLVFLLISVEAQPDDTRKDSLGRVAFAIAAVVWMVFAHRLLRRRGALVESKWFRDKLWLASLQWAWYAAAMLLPLGLLIASLAGYQYTAIQLAYRIGLTLGAMLATRLIAAMSERWLLLTRRKLALEQARQRLAARQEAKEEDEEAEPQPEVQLEVDLPAISNQTRQLLDTAVVIGLTLGIVTIWAPVLPALNLLDSVTLPFTKISLMDSGIALLATVLTWLAVKNLPGLLEIAILQHIPMDQSARHAASALARYAIFVVGLTSVLAALGVGWDNVQWLVAAVSVGLGFGLQEIFANFVSGLILMFERPIRLGDVVTVGGITGTVTKINTRATTIVDWDRKELIIPNREFVTGQIVNWSLTDQVLRVVINVGIAYGSDTQKAREILLEVAEENQRVLDDPRPRAFFLGFGASSLDFDLRCFVSHIDDWLLAKHELHMAIDEAFRAAAIEISFPQRDLHVRSLDPSILQSLSEARGD